MAKIFGIFHQQIALAAVQEYQHSHIGVAASSPLAVKRYQICRLGLEI